MSLSDTYCRDIARFLDKEASLRKELQRHESDAAKAMEDTHRQEASALRTSSASSRNSYLNAAERARKKALDASRIRDQAIALRRLHRLKIPDAIIAATAMVGNAVLFSNDES